MTLHAGGGDPIDDEEAFLEEIGVAPDEIEDAGDPPWKWFSDGLREF